MIDLMEALQASVDAAKGKQSATKKRPATRATAKVKAPTKKAPAKKAPARRSA